MKEILIKQMHLIASQLQTGDKGRAIKDIPISEPTLNKYLSGQIVKLEVADRIITYFSKLYKTS